MNWTPNAKTVGAMVGLVIGLLFVVLGWKAFLILLGFVLAGLAIGLWLDSSEEVKRRVQGLARRLFGG